VHISRALTAFDWIHRRSNGEDFPTEVLLSVFNLGSEKYYKLL